MAIVKTRQEKLRLNVDGPDGNAFAVMGMAKNLARQIGIDHKPIIEEMMSGDYIHLLKTFTKHFDKVCDIETTNSSYLKLLS